MIREWHLFDERIIAQNQIFTLKTQTSSSPRTGRRHEFYVIEAGDWVNIIPLTAAGEVLLVRQFRHGTRNITLEIPGGMIEAGQTPEQAALRELIEETGYQPSDLSFLGRVRPNPAILNNWCYSFLAHNVVPAGELALDETEDIELVKVPLDQIPGLISEGTIDHSLVLSAFFFFRDRGYTAP